VIRGRSGERRPRAQRGFAMLALLSLILLLGAYFIANALTQTSSELVNTREQRNMKALLQAKAALIAYAASTEGWQTYKGQTTNQPGGLPCPDRDNPPDGISNTAGCSGAGSNRVGRLPWSTIGSDDLRDASGEQIWYAVSSNFYKNVGTNDVNSDTQGLLNVTGTVSATSVVAVVIAPGVPILGQNRSGVGVIDPAQYLEGYAAGASDYTFATNALPSETFNDRVLTITQADIMAAVEPVVAARIERDVKPQILDYYAKWGVFPFPAAFSPGPGTTGAGSTRAQNSYTGDTTQTSGLLPLTTSSTWVTWKTSGGAITVTNIPGQGTGSSSITSTSCAASTGSQISCTVNYSGGSGDRVAIQLQATLQNAGMSFVNPTALTDVSLVDRNGAATAWSTGSPTFTPTATSSMQATGNATVTILGRLRSASSTSNRVTISIPVPAYHAITSSADPNSGWFIQNEWFRQVYYAVSPGFLPSGGGTCNTRPTPPAAPLAPSCLTVNNLPPYYSSANAAKERVLLVLAGRTLTNNPRPSSALGDYLENANLIAATGTAGTALYVYENRSGSPTSINDRVVVIAP
jgi:hypothetical protein